MAQALFVIYLAAALILVCLSWWLHLVFLTSARSIILHSPGIGFRLPVIGATKWLSEALYRPPDEGEHCRELIRANAF